MKEQKNVATFVFQTKLSNAIIFRNKSLKYTELIAYLEEHVRSNRDQKKLTLLLLAILWMMVKHSRTRTWESETTKTTKLPDYLSILSIHMIMRGFRGGIRGWVLPKISIFFPRAPPSQSENLDPPLNMIQKQKQQHPQ